jgi:hypothetical protein
MDLFKIVILVCSAEMAPQDCQTDNAIDVIAGPTVTTVMACGHDGQAYIAQTSLLDEHTYPKMLCRHARFATAPLDSDRKTASVADTPVEAGRFGAR